MKTSDFTTTILVDQTPMEAFDAINDVRAWWPGEIEGESTRIDDEFTYRYKKIHFSKQRLVEVIPGKKVVWLVTDSSLNFVENKTEWTGTKIVFDISEKNNKTEVRFTHIGLVPQYECFTSCSNAWTDIISNGLRNLIATGKGQADLEKA